MNPHERFTAAEVRANVGAARLRGVILDTIALRVGQVPDVHPNLLEGIETAARILHAQEVAAAELNALRFPPVEQLDERLLLVFLSGFAAGTSGEVRRQGAPLAYAHAYGRHIAEHLERDPIACAQVLEGIRPLFTTGDVPPDAPDHIQVHNGHPGGDS